MLIGAEPSSCGPMEMRLVFRVFGHKSKGSDGHRTSILGWPIHGKVTGGGVVATHRREAVLIENVNICPGPGRQESHRTHLSPLQPRQQHLDLHVLAMVK